MAQTVRVKGSKLKKFSSGHFIWRLSDKNQLGRNNICNEKISKTFLVPNFVYVAYVCQHILQTIHSLQETQSLGIHDILNAQGFAMHYRTNLNTVSCLELFRCERILYSKAKG